MKLTDKIKRDLITSAEVGNKRAVAAKSAGISAMTLSNWLRKGMQGNELYQDFAVEYLKAEAKDEASLVGLLKNSLVDGEGNPVPSVAMYLLNNRHGWNKVASQVAEKFIDYLVDKLGEDHKELLTSILEDIEGGAIL